MKMMKTLIWAALSPRARTAALARPAQAGGANPKHVRAILARVKAEGDAAVRAYSRRFDGAAPRTLRIPARELAVSLDAAPPALRKAMARARANITAFHKAAMPRAVQVDTMPGVRCLMQWRPLETVGLYIPGGSAPLFSTLIMQAVPARLAGCKRIVVCTPPGKGGRVDPAVLAAAELCGLTEVYAVGGVQAIAAMAYGTASIPRVDKIFGPGNAYVTLAKQLVTQEGVAIDLPAGPSEVMVLADASARAGWVAADLLAQAEHDTIAQAILVTTSAAFARKVQAEVARQLPSLPRRDVAAASLKGARLIVAPDIATAIEISNLYAPEHLILHLAKAGRYLPRIAHAGSVFLGPYTPESAGDYASGTNHVLPTYGAARTHGGLSVQSFMKSMTAQTITAKGLARLGPAIIAMAEAEGLAAHAAAVRLRLEATR
jgi:histidinol dehydrogenase